MKWNEHTHMIAPAWLLVDTLLFLPRQARTLAPGTGAAQRSISELTTPP
jgi:hypothetical protein